MKKPFNYRELCRFCLYFFMATAFVTNNVLLLFNDYRGKIEWESIGNGSVFTLLNIIGLSLAVWLIDRHRRMKRKILYLADRNIGIHLTPTSKHSEKETNHNKALMIKLRSR